MQALFNEQLADTGFDLDGWRASSLTFPESELQILDANGERNMLPAACADTAYTLHQTLRYNLTRNPFLGGEVCTRLVPQGLSRLSVLDL